MKKLTDKQRTRLKAAALPDSQIDTSDIPEITNFSGGVRGRFVNPGTMPVSLRINRADLSRARIIAEQKGLSYQSLLKSLIHEGLERAAK